LGVIGYKESSGKSEATCLLDDYSVLQNILLPVESSVEDELLYVRPLTGYAEISDSTLQMQKNASISFNTYFNSFYADYWKHLTGVENVFLEIEFSGSIAISVFEDVQGRGCNRISSIRVDAKIPTVRIFPIPFSMGVGRIFFDITALEKSSVRVMRFVTDKKRAHKISLSIGICTFNREKFLLKNLRALLKEDLLLDSISKIILVNQGPSFDTPELAELVGNTPQVSLIEQGNLGGCGGFTRTMYEAMRIEGVTHHVLMDDDARIDPRVLDNLVLLLSFSGNSKVIGGHMLDLVRPQVLYEAGALVKSNTRLISLNHNVDLRSVFSLTSFSKYQRVDYNAWWFCVIPTEHLRKQELPAPIFIRGDDMEYGIRLQEAGIQTVAMPGIAVWHEPFYLKVGGWQVYYDLRNRLILASTYPERFKLEAPVDLLWSMLKAAVSHDYLTCELLVRATRDFLYGPNLLTRSADEIHSEISSLAKTLALPTIAESELPAPPVKLRRMPKSDLGLARLVVWRFVQNIATRKPERAKLLLDREANISNIGPNPYVKTNQFGSYYLLYAPDRLRLLGAFYNALCVLWVYVRRKRKVSKAWADQVPAYRTPQFWESTFDADAKKNVEVLVDKKVLK